MVLHPIRMTPFPPACDGVAWRAKHEAGSGITAARCDRCLGVERVWMGVVVRWHVERMAFICNLCVHELDSDGGRVAAWAIARTIAMVGGVTDPELKLRLHAVLAELEAA